MLEIRQPPITFLSRCRPPQLREASVDEVREDPGIRIASYRNLVKTVAELAFANPEYVLLFRGQEKDYHEDNKSTLLPTMFRFGDRREMYGYELKDRYRLIEEKEDALVRRFRGKYQNRISRNSLLRWAILQHYEICPTPLLDVTHSLHVAASFAFAGVKAIKGESVLYVLGLPQISGSVTVASDQSLQIVRLSSVCPPTTLRPYFQEGYLIGTFPVLDSLNAKMLYHRSEVDGANRLIAKLRLKRSGFWTGGFKKLPNEALYPDEELPFNRRLLALRDTNNK